MRGLIAIVFGWVALFNPTAAATAEDRIEMIVARGDGVVELFLAMPSELAISHFGLSQRDLTNDAGFADFQRFSAGTFELGQRFWGDVDAQLGGAPVEFETMSLMVHPVWRPLPFETPLDALKSVEVCGVTDQNVALSDTHLYVGLIAYPRHPHAQLTFDLPETLPAAVEVSVRDFIDHRLANADVLRAVETSGVSRVEVAALNEPSLSGLALFCVTLLLAFLAYVGTRENGPYLTS